MKKLPFVLFLIACRFFSFAQEAITLDKAIQNGALYLIGRLPADSKVVILNFQSEHPKLSDYIIEELTTNMVNDKNSSLVVVDRQNLELLQQEMVFQMSGEVDDETAQAIGKKLGAQTIISGSIVPLGDDYRLRIRAIEVQTARIAGSQNTTIVMDLILAALTGTPYTPRPSTRPGASVITQAQPEPEKPAESRPLDPVEAEPDAVASAIRTRAEQAAPKPTPPPKDKDAWKRKALYIGGRVAYSDHSYTLFDDGGSPTVGGHGLGDFGWNKLDYTGYLSFQFVQALALQVEFSYVTDTVSVTYSSPEYRKDYTSSSLMIPVLLKLTLWPGYFLIQGYGGAYYSLPLEKLSYKEGTHSDTFTISPSIGWTAGGSLGVKLGFGVFYVDARVGDALGYTKINGDDRDVRTYKRFFASYSVGFEFGLITRKKR
ncbi:MAG: CsgG/HfaB family protein [Treponema sp.]|nr:CsgG/HfaB family protein [Treponema sp.]